MHLLIVPGSGPSLMGRDWLQHLTLDWTLLHVMNIADGWQKVVDRHTDVFKEELGRRRSNFRGYTEVLPTTPCTFLTEGKSLIGWS